MICGAKYVFKRQNWYVGGGNLNISWRMFLRRSEYDE